MSDQKRYLHVTTGTLIPVPGGKQIREMIGRVHTGDLAHRDED